ncbi:AAA family ATPase [Mycolicibacterium pallens]|uniref:AAA family ATPase n=1 Tax=Mycolicibacterium pallens TaxID=370524 RepID=A0ABX8VJ03_9MYCO|nr:AAA family ATPase [Mycolicibacterium pallens]QYL17789.1 AAA family ATPase [Mycolicibacterium pallens]
MTRFAHGLLIGKFYPPHLGHHAAIRSAAAQCDRFTVLVMAGASETIPLADRLAWLRAEHAGEPGVRVIGIRCDAPLDVNDQRVWAAQVVLMEAALRQAGEPVRVDAVFSGEEYGAELARWFGAASVRFERDEVSGTAVRRDLAGRWMDLAPATRAGLTTRVVLVGAESTGTTTLSRLLSEHYAARGGSWALTHCVEEYGREYTRLKWDGSSGSELVDLVWTVDDFDAIGREQTRREEAAAAVGSPVLICDTDAFATSIWERRYLGSAARVGQPWAGVAPRAVYLVTDHEGVEWHDDGMREGDLRIREAMTGWCIDALTVAGHSWVLLTGSLSERLDIAIRTIDPLLELRARFGAPLHGPGFGGTTEMNPRVI